MRAGLPGLALALLVAASAADAGWQDAATPFDANRLAQLEEAKTRGLAEAAAGHDLATLHAVLDPPPQAISAESLSGRWRCRTIKLGGVVPDVIYGWFRCRIAARGDMLSFEKISGSQRLAGTLYPDGSGRYVLLGALSTTGEPVHEYSGNRAGVGAIATPDDVAGVLVATGPGHARIEFPYPLQESTFDVMELKR
jgi:hypothetical protein